MTTVRAIAWCLAAILWTCSLAAEPSASEVAVARELFREGATLQNAGDWARAAEKYREAVSIKDTPGLRYRIGYCEEQQVHLVEAKLEYERAHELIHSGLRAPDVDKLLPEALANLTARLPEVTLVLTEPVEGASFKLDGTLVANTLLGKPAPINPGTHQLEVRAPGYHTYMDQVIVGEGERRTVTVKLKPTTSSAAPAPTNPAPGEAPDAEPPEPGVSNRTLVLVSGAVLSAGALAVGIFYTVEADAQRDRRREPNAILDEFGNTNVCSDVGTPGRDEPARVNACRDLDVAVRAQAEAEDRALAGFITAGSLAVLTTATFFLWQPEAVNVAVQLSPWGGDISLTAHW